MVEIDTNDEPDLKNYDKDFFKEFLERLQISNSDIAANLDKCPDDEKPVLRVFQKGTSPMHEQQVQNPHRKKQYIFGLNLKSNEAKSLKDKIEDGKLVTVLD